MVLFYESLDKGEKTIESNTFPSIPMEISGIQNDSDSAFGLNIYYMQLAIILHFGTVFKLYPVEYSSRFQTITRHLKKDYIIFLLQIIIIIIIISDMVILGFEGLYLVTLTTAV